MRLILCFFAFEDHLNRALLLALVSLDSTVLIFMFAGFNMWFIFFDCLLLSCCKMLKCSTDFRIHRSFSAFEDNLNRANAWSKFRWIQLV